VQPSLNLVQKSRMWARVMLFSLVILGGCDRAAERRLVGSRPAKRRALPSAPGVGTDTPQVGCCRATFGCPIGTSKKSAAYEISGALQHRAAAFRYLVEDKREQSNWQMKRQRSILEKRNTLEERQKRGCCGSTALPIVVGRRSWREISFWKTSKGRKKKRRKERRSKQPSSTAEFR